MPSIVAKIDDPGFDVDHIRDHFPILSTKTHGKPLVFLDSAASSQKPRAVIDAVLHCYEAEYANIHRGVYALSETATRNYEDVREKVRALINAKETREIIFLRGATEGINLVAVKLGWGQPQTWRRNYSSLHSNITPTSCRGR